MSGARRACGRRVLSCDASLTLLSPSSPALRRSVTGPVPTGFAPSRPWVPGPGCSPPGDGPPPPGPSCVSCGFAPLTLGIRSSGTKTPAQRGCVSCGSAPRGAQPQGCSGKRRIAERNATGPRPRGVAPARLMHPPRPHPRPTTRRPPLSSGPLSVAPSARTPFPARCPRACRAVPRPSHPPRHPPCPPASRGRAFFHGSAAQASSVRTAE